MGFLFVQVWNATCFSRVVLVLDFWHPELATPADRAAVLDLTRRQRYEATLATRTFERADSPAAAASDAPARSDEGPEGRGAAGQAEGEMEAEGLGHQSSGGRASGMRVGGVARHCVGLSAHVLGSRGMRTLERCVDAVLGVD